MATLKKLAPIDLDAFDEIEERGVVAVRRRGRGLGAKLEKSGLTTAQTRVVIESTQQIIRVMSCAKRPVQSGKKIVNLQKTGKTIVLTIKGL